VALGSAPSGVSLGGTTTRNASGGIAVFSDLTLTKAATGYTLFATASGLGNATSQVFAIRAGPATQLTFTVQPGATLAGSAISPAPTVVVDDAFGNTVTSPNVSVTLNLVSNPGNTNLKGATTTTSSGGVATFPNVSVARAGKGYTLAARAPGIARARSTAFDVVAGNPVALGFVTQPTGVAPGTTFVPGVQVALLDALGNVADNATDTVALALGPAPANGAVLSGVTSSPTYQGIASFPGLQLDRVGAGYTLNATSVGGLPTKTSRAFDVAADAQFLAADSIPVPLLAATTAMGDLDGDGVPDLAVLDTGNHKVTILMGLGSMRYGPPTTIALLPLDLTYPKIVAFVDLDRDGKLDMIIVGSGSNNIGVFMGNGDGTFGAPTLFPVGTNPQYGVGIGDFDEDGNLDIATGGAFTSSVTVLFGDGAGGFPRRSDFDTGGSQPHGVDCADIDGDGHLDLAVAVRLSNEVVVFRGDGEGNFSIAATVPVGAEPRVVRLADLDHNGAVDIVTANDTGPNVAVALNQGGFTFGPASAISMPGNQGQICTVGDVNGDSIPDLVAPCGAAFLLLGTGSGSFGPPSPLAAGVGPYSCDLFDLRHTGRPDILVSNDADLGSAGPTAETVTAFANLGGGTFAQAPAYAAGASPSGLAMGDLDKDGHPDAVVCNPAANTVSVCLGTGGGAFGAATTHVVGSNPVAVRIADLDKDGNLDIVTVNSGDGTVTVLLGTGGGAFGSPTSYPAGSAPSDLALADVDGDGILDCVVTNPAANQINVLLGTGTGAFGAPKSYAVPNGPSRVVVTDLNGDLANDVVVTTPGANAVAVLLNLGTGALGTPVTYSTGPSPVALAAGDVDGDHRTDLVVVNASGTASVLLGTGTGAFGAPLAYTVGVNPVAIALTDLDGDGNLDAVVINQATGDASILMGRGAGAFAGERRYAVGAGPASVAVADVNGDGRLDLVSTNTVDGTVSVLLGLSTTLFTDTVDARANLYQAAWPGNPFTSAEASSGALAPRSVQLAGSPRDFAGASFVDVSASGVIQADGPNFTGPDGWVGTPWRGLTMFGLIGIWSSDPASIVPIGAAFDVGANRTLAVPVGAHAYLVLAENDGDFVDNTGSFAVVFSAR
jgi:hypothetical protein